MNFKSELKTHIESNFYQRHGEENHDANRYGPYQPMDSGVFTDLQRRIKKAVGYKTGILAEMQMARIAPFMDRLEKLWSCLNVQGKRNLVELISYRLLGKHRVKLFTNNPSYVDSLKIAASLQKGTDTVATNFLHFVLNRFDLTPAGYPLEMFFRAPGVAGNFLIEQYAYKENAKPLVEVKPGNVVLDLGGCYGDTALYFAHKAGESGRVHVFEFIPNNLKILKQNLAMNPLLEKRVQVVEHPVSDTSDQNVYYLDFGPASHVSAEPFENQTGITTTLSVDDFVERNNIERVDFIKMDIEGSEPAALRGAEKTIRRFRPTLAIAIYHSMDDFVNIPEWICNLQLPYDYYLGHYTIHSEETIFFAKPKA